MAKNYFVTGETYITRSACDHNCVFTYKILQRSAKSVKISREMGPPVTRRLNKDETGLEFIYPEGKYSMCPVLKADGIKLA